MKRLFQLSLLFLILCGVFALSGCRKEAPAPAPAAINKVGGDTIAMSIFYAGHPGSNREKDFVTFLEGHFTKVATGDLADFDGSQSAGFDVTILDYDGDGFESPRPRISSLTSPVVTMGVTGAFICDQQSLKTGYL